MWGVHSRQKRRMVNGLKGGSKVTRTLTQPESGEKKRWLVTLGGAVSSLCSEWTEKGGWRRGENYFDCKGRD